MDNIKLALALPGFGEVSGNPASNFNPQTVKVGEVITQFGEVAIFVGGFLMFFWACWGVFDYIRAEGNKEALAKARKRIQWAIIGFIILLIAFFASEFVQEFLTPQDVPLEQIIIN